MSPSSPSCSDARSPEDQYLHPNSFTPIKHGYSSGSAGSAGAGSPCNYSPGTPLSESNLSQHNKEWTSRKLDNSYIEDCIRNEGTREFDHAACSSGINPNELQISLEDIIRLYSAGRASAQSPLHRYASIVPTEEPFYAHRKEDMETLGLKSGTQEDRLKRKELADMACGATNLSNSMNEKELEEYRVRYKKMKFKEKEANDTEPNADDPNRNERMNRDA